MPKHVLQLHCPCCRKPIEVDTRSGRARAMATRDNALDDLIDAQKHESERLGGIFDTAREQHGTESERLDGLFRKAKEDADDDDSKPSNPFDLE